MAVYGFLTPLRSPCHTSLELRYIFSCYSTLLPFKELLEEILVRVLNGTSSNTTDGPRNYSSMKDHVIDPVHK